MFSYEIISGIEMKEMIEYFKLISKVQKEEHRFVGDGWTVELTPLPRSSNQRLNIPRTKVMFYGNETVCRDIIMKYRYKFMRGGG
ncbi:hypothetical protein [Serpentinicella alkaliphila]|uniref:Molybdopterin cofactor biosynthesis MoaD-related C-terminal domain-containing protein n=1 Tax=Serpentinicella alkaliphila TaxID=1734049 RepID=A0A4V6NSK7_9FIRM|nr:hypothetical protein [Serpentinicella alkaliphila]QUH26855.1 hypothetical protein HZR23_14740 [Serpentinicella alkaliphila]TCQ08084.1 hypothetical protein EDD79_1001172 [Serpentinicella alkaliphila]